MAVYVFDEDGIDGMPETAMDSAIVAINNYGWVVFSNVFNVTIYSGDFYIVLEQLSNSDSSAPIAVDTDIPTVYRYVVKLDGSN